MNATTFTNSTSARTILTNAFGAERAEGFMRTSDTTPDGSVVVYGVSRQFLIDEGFVPSEIKNGHTHWVM